MLQDLRFALRLLNRHRGYAFVAVVTVALGVGANTAVFSVADSVLFRPLPFADADRLFVLRISDPVTHQVYGTLPGSGIDAARATGLFDAIAAFNGLPAPAYVRRAEGLDVLALAGASPGYLEMLNVRPVLGRTFNQGDAGTHVVLLTYRTWIRKYGGDPAVVGMTLPTVARASDTTGVPESPLHVVGVLPPSLRLPSFISADGMMLTDEPVGGAGRTHPPLVRLKAGVRVAVAQAELAALRTPDLIPGKSELRLVPIREELAAGQDPTLWLLIAASGIVLAVACANLANLMLAHGAARARELAVRAALGGSRWRMMRLLLADGVCIGAFGALAGALTGYGGFRYLSDRLPPGLALATMPAFDRRALIFAVAIAGASMLAFTLLPAVRLSRADGRDGLGLERLQQSAPRRGRRLLVAVEVAICLTLVTGAGLVGRSLLVLLTEDLGFAVHHRLQASFDLPTMPVRRGPRLHADMLANMAFMETRLRDVRAVPGVRAATVASAVPFSRRAPDFPLTAGRGADAGGVYSVASDYVRTLGMSLIAGRDITLAESETAAPVGVLNERGARLLCGAPAECLGHVIQSPRQPPRTVVGVVRDMRMSLKALPMAAMYAPFDPSLRSVGSIIVDADDSPAVRDQLMRTLSTSKDALVEIRSLDEDREAELASFRFDALVVGGFALLTLGLAVVGVYGVMAAVVGERTREYGVRIALGATRERISRHVLGQAALPIGVGVAGGVALAGWGSRYVASLLYGVVPLDPVSFAAALAIVSVGAVAAAVAPAIRAAQVDPIVALRAE